LLAFLDAWDNAINMTQTTKAWLKGLIVAVVSGAASVGAGIAMARTEEEYKLILSMAAFDAFKSMCAYLKQSPLPGVAEGKQA